jgi:hypothetical protein
MKLNGRNRKHHENAVESYRRFREASISKQAANTYETSGNYYQTAQGKNILYDTLHIWASCEHGSELSRKFLTIKAYYKLLREDFAPWSYLVRQLLLQLKVARERYMSVHI